MLSLLPHDLCHGRSASRRLPTQPHGLKPTRLLRPWDFLGKGTGVGCHCLLLIQGGLTAKKKNAEMGLSVINQMKVLQLVLLFKSSVFGMTENDRDRVYSRC